MAGDTLREKAYRHVQAKILSGEYAPGQKISELSVAKEIGISRTPVRSAIRELEREGFLEQVARYGTIVRKANRRDIEELYDMRRALEGFAAECACDRMNDEDVGLLRDLYDRTEVLITETRKITERPDEDTLRRFVEADMQFHVVILRSTGNRRLMKSVSDSRLLSEWGRYARRPHHIDMLATAWAQHLTILQAIEAREGNQANKAMSAHIAFGKNLAISIFDRMEAEGLAEELLTWNSPPSLDAV
ncbi:MAG: GntR family transcriptional regulator [Planctomycetota bacterium]|nr:GntR family transcriptional regulator [Planctomycetota bacterium]